MENETIPTSVKPAPTITITGTLAPIARPFSWLQGTGLLVFISPLLRRLQTGATKKPVTHRLVCCTVSHLHSRHTFNQITAPDSVDLTPVCRRDAESRGQCLRLAASRHRRFGRRPCSMFQQRKASSTRMVWQSGAQHGQPLRWSYCIVKCSCTTARRICRMLTRNTSSILTRWKSLFNGPARIINAARRAPLSSSIYVILHSSFFIRARQCRCFGLEATRLR